MHARVLFTIILLAALPAAVSASDMQETAAASLHPALHTISPPDDPLIEHYINWYLSPEGRNVAQALLERAALYEGFIHDRLLERNMPPELAFLPAIESGFRPWAVSSSGASGLWQFMMNSITPYDITVNEWRDDRRDFWKSTEAALSKLEYNHQKLGSWPLAIAAYNCGLGRITRAVEAAGSTDFMILSENGLIPDETRHYLPRFMAFAHIASYRGRYGFDTDPEGRPESGKWERIELNQAVSLETLSAKAGIPVEVMRKANAELRFGISPPASEKYYLKTPAIYAERIKDVLDSNDKPLLRFYIHEIGSGDTYYALSRHFRVPVSMIESYNPGKSATALRTGMRILIPALHETEPFRTTEREPEKWLNPSDYCVRQGDSLWSISRIFGISPEELAYNNGMKTDGILKTGTLLQVPGEKNND